ncbi:MAG: hypothetical protein ACJ786_11180 [Catenulispora sp.]
MAKQIPADAPRSEDGFYWWDQEGNDGEGQWQPVHEPEPAAPKGGAQHGGGAHQDGSPQNAQKSVRLDLNHYPALWRLSQIYPNDDGVTQYLSQLGIDVGVINWELHQSDRDAFYNAVPAASNAIYEVVAQIMGDTSGVTVPVATAAVEAMTQVVATGAPIRDLLYSEDHGTESEHLREELDELRYEVGWLRQAVAG